MSQFLLIHYCVFFTYYLLLTPFYTKGAVEVIEKYHTGANQHSKKYLKGANRTFKNTPQVQTMVK